MEQKQIDALKDDIRIWAPEDFEDAADLRAIYDGTKEVPAEMVTNLRNLGNDYDLEPESEKALQTATDEELKQILKEYITDFVDGRLEDEREDIRYAVSNWFDDHCGRDDFDNEYQRVKYFEELSEGEGDVDYIYDCVMEDVEYEFLTDDEANEVFDDAVQSEADYYYSTSR